MRKLYAMLAGIFMILFSSKSFATPDQANFTAAVVPNTTDVVFTNTSTLGNEPGVRKAFWSFGDGTMQQTPPLSGTQHHYQVAGVYNVCLRIYRYTSNTADSILSAQVCKTVVIETACHADFTTTAISPTAAAYGRYFLAQPSHNQNKKPVLICWQFGDGRDTCIQYSTTYTGSYGVYHQYTQAGNYNVCVNIHYDGGCQASNCHIVEVVNPDSCRADFERINITQNPNPRSVMLRALPWHNNNKRPVRICWQFGDGKDTCIQYSATATTPYIVSHNYAYGGVYNVCVNILYQGGCEATKCRPIVVVQPDSCQADFERYPTTAVNNPLTVVYKALPFHNNNKPPVKICWQFGDGTDTCINYTTANTIPYTVIHTYQYPGLYNVCVKINYLGGCEAVKCKLIQVGRPDTCAADFERLQTPNINDPLLAIFKALPQHNNNRKPSRICWQFGDNHDTCINYPENFTGQYLVTHRYQNPGQYNVCVNIKYYGGCESSKCKNIAIIRPDTCGADFERIQITPANNPLFAYYRAILQHNNNRMPSRICWQFGDGRDTCINYTESYTGLYAVGHQYLQPGVYNVCISIRYFGGCEAQRCRSVIVGQQPDSCTADFERGPVVASSPLTVGFTALPWNNNNRKPSRICWQFGDGRDTCIEYPNTYSGPYNVVHHYSQPGQYQVCVSIRYYGGCEATKCRNIILQTVQNCSVTLFELTPSITSLTRGLVAVTAAVPPAPVQRICWHFGDGTDTCININATTPVNSYSISHTYPGPGTYHACVHVRFANGCEADNCRDIVIQGLPNVCGGYMTDSLIGTRNYRFKAFSIHAPNDNVLSYTWSFGDGTSATGQQVTHQYNQGGTFNVCVLIRTQLGCETRICKPLLVPGSNATGLILSPNPVINVLNATFFSTLTETVTIRILNSTGTPVRTYTRNAVAGPNTWSFDVASLVPGIYSCVVQSPNQLASAIFLKQ